MLTGSPNFSRPALLRPARDGNAEFAVLRHEPDPKYLDLTMSPVSGTAVPLELDWIPSAEETDEATDGQWPTYRTVRAEFSAGKLSVVVEPEVPEDARVSIELVGREERSFEVERWDREGDAIVLEPPPDLLGMFSTPLSMRLLIGTAHERDFSTRAVVNSTSILRSSSRPVRRQEQGRVPARLVSENFQEDIELLNRLQNLLALNPQQLRERRGLSGRMAKDLEREAGMTTEEGDYDPEAMIVDERLRRIEVPTGSDLYVDFYDRAFYEDVLAAARAAVYRPVVEATATPGQSQENGTLSTDEPRRPEPTGKTHSDKDAAERVTRSFARIVTGFERGMQDSEYLVLVPSTYVQELFFVLTTYLRSLWRQGLVVDKSFLDLSERLFAAFLGDERESAGWSAISDASTHERLMRDKHLSRYREQAWLHLYLLADRSPAEAKGRLPYLARLMRRCTQELAPPTLLLDLPSDTFAAMWRNSFSRDRSVPELEAVVNDLLEYSEWYSEETLRQELALLLGSTVTIIRRDAFGLRAVPIMLVKGAWSADHLDVYWRAFCRFCRWPEWKINARLEVHNANPTSSKGSATPLEFFYRGNMRRLTVWAKPDANTRPINKELKSASLRELCERPTFDDAIRSG